MKLSSVLKTLKARAVLGLPGRPQPQVEGQTSVSLKLPSAYMAYDLVFVSPSSCSGRCAEEDGLDLAAGQAVEVEEAEDAAPLVGAGVDELELLGGLIVVVGRRESAIAHRRGVEVDVVLGVGLPVGGDGLELPGRVDVPGRGSASTRSTRCC